MELNNNSSNIKIIQKHRQNFCYHTHTRRCGHAEDVSDEQYVIQAINAGMNKLAFTDHGPLLKNIKTTRKVRMNSTEVKSYLNSIKYLKEKYKGKIEIESGFEFEYTDREIEYLNELKAKTDKMILGQHFVVDKEGNEHIFRQGIVSDKVLDLYAEAIITAMEKGVPDIIAHPDRFISSRKNFGKKEEQISRLICQKAIETGIPLEINMGEPLDNLIGSNIPIDELRKVVSYPSREFWEIVAEESKKARQAGKNPIKVIYGKDAHSPNRISETRDYELVDKIIGVDILKELYFVKNDLKTYNEELVSQFALSNNSEKVVLSSETAKKFARIVEVANEKKNANAIIASMEKNKEVKNEESLYKN